MRSLRWIQGVLFGCVVGAAVLEVPGLALLFGLLCLLWASLDGARPSGMGGLFLGSGTGMALLIGAANARCAAFNTVPDQGCAAPDATPYLVVAGALVVLGAVLTALALRRGAAVAR